MKYLILLAALCAVALCAPFDHYVVSVKQDTSGKYRFEYNIGDMSRLEERSEDGSVRGEFTYVDGDGLPQKIEYLSGEQGFLVRGTNLPVAPLPVEDTHEVAMARREFLEIYEDVKSKLPPLPEDEQH